MLFPSAKKNKKKNDNYWWKKQQFLIRWKIVLHMRVEKISWISRHQDLAMAGDMVNFLNEKALFKVEAHWNVLQVNIFFCLNRKYVFFIWLAAMNSVTLFDTILIKWFHYAYLIEHYKASINKTLFKEQMLSKQVV